MKTNTKISVTELGFDFDGVLADIGEVFVRLACEEHNYCSFTLDDIINFTVEECIQIPPDIIATIFNDILEDSLATRLRPMDGMIEVIGDLAELGPITIVTARTKAQPVQDWLAHHLPKKTCSQIRLVAMGDHDDKVRYLKDLKLKYFIDDRLETCRQVAEANLTPYIFSNPWNNSNHGFATVSTWSEIRNLVDL